MDILDLSELFNTKPQAVDFSARIEYVIGKVFEKTFNPEKLLLEQFGIEKKEKLITLMRDNRVNLNSRIDIKNFLEKVKEKIDGMTVVSIVIAFEPKEKSLQTLSRWFVSSINKQVLFDVKVDRSLIGGAAILYQGKYLDYSIKPDFEKAYERTFTKPKIAEVKDAPAENANGHTPTTHN